MAKKLFLLVSDSGDGSSYSIQYTFNQAWIDTQQDLYDDKLDYRSAGVDGAGFNYKTLTVPDECTLETLGIYGDCAEDIWHLQ